MRKKNLPAVISSLLNRIESFVYAHCLYGRKGIYRAMRSERIAAITTLLTCLAKSLCLSQDGAFVRVVDGVAYPLTVGDMCRLSGLKRYTVERSLQDLRQLGFIESSTQQKRTGEDGLEVGPVLRRFTQKFWRAVGLWSLFVEGVKYAVRNTKITVAWLFKSVARLKAKMKSLATSKIDDAERQRQRNSRNFVAFVECLKRRGGSCFGGANSQAVCELCRLYR